MDVRDYLVVLRRRWAWVAAAVVLTLAGSLGWIARTPPTYASGETLFLVGAAQDSGAATRLNSYASLATSSRLVDAVRKDLGLTRSTTDVAGRLTAVAAPNTLIITVTATDSSPTGARMLASRAARELVTLSTTLDPPTATGSPVPRLVAADFATPATRVPTGSRTVGFGLVLGLLAGIVLALAREATDGRLRSTEQVRRLTGPGAPVVDVGDASDPLPSGQVSPGFRLLRTVLLHGGHALPANFVVTVCGPAPAPGVASAFALTLARAGQRVALVAADLRPGRRTVGEWSRGVPGLGDVLADGLPPAVSLLPGPHHDLFLLPAGRPLPYPEDALASDTMGKVVGELRAGHDVVVVDVPPLSAHADAVSVTESTGATVLLVVVRGRTLRGDLRAVLETLGAAGAPPAAVVLVRPPRRHAEPPARPDDEEVRVIDLVARPGADRPAGTDVRP